ncbi:MAG TPA: hypothetical protein VIE39_05750, partial [Thermoanaerobaculia bacterium]
LLPVLELWRAGRHRELPVYRAAGAPIEELEERGHAIVRALRARGSRLQISLVASSALFGGGTSPEKAFASRALAVTHEEISSERLLERLRGAPTPVIGRAHEGAVLLDLRSIAPREDAAVVAALTAAGDRR